MNGGSCNGSSQGVMFRIPVVNTSKAGYSERSINLPFTKSDIKVTCLMRPAQVVSSLRHNQYREAENPS